MDQLVIVREGKKWSRSYSYSGGFLAFPRLEKRKAGLMAAQRYDATSELSLGSHRVQRYFVCSILSSGNHLAAVRQNLPGDKAVPGRYPGDKAESAE